MLTPKMEKAFNDQINAELYSAYLYMSMATWLDSLQLSGMSHWMRVQAQEEMTHAIRLHNFVRDRGGRVLLAAVDAPPTQWDSPEAIFLDVQAHERQVTGMIHALVDLAQDERDHASNSFLTWFVNEQVEEEANADELVGQIRLMHGAGDGLYMLDKELSARVFTMPVDLVI